MSEDKNSSSSSSSSSEDVNGPSDDIRPATSSALRGDEDTGVLIEGPVLDKSGETELVTPNPTIHFRIPQNQSGTFPVEIKYYYGNNVISVVDGNYTANNWHTVEVQRLPESVGHFKAQWRHDNGMSNTTMKHIVVRENASFDAVSVVAVVVTGPARQGSVIKLVRPGVGTVLSGTVTVGASEQWSVSLLSSVDQGPQDFAIREDVTGTTGRYTQTKRLTVLKVPSITGPTQNAVVIDRNITISGKGLAGAVVHLYHPDGAELKPKEGLK